MQYFDWLRLIQNSVHNRFLLHLLVVQIFISMILLLYIKSNSGLIFRDMNGHNPHDSEAPRIKCAPSLSGSFQEFLVLLNHQDLCLSSEAAYTWFSLC